MIQIYEHNNINYSSNGDMNLQPTLCNLKVELNGICEIELEHNYDKECRWEYIIEDNIVAAPTPWSKKQLFRIYSKNKTMTGIKCYARHIFFDLINYILLDVRPTVKTAQEALNIILQGTPFSGISNINKVNTAYYIRKNVLESIAGDDENSFVNRWGGERLYDNYNVIINDKIGQDNGVRAEFGYNLEGIEEDINIDDVVTRIIPTGYNGIMLDGPMPWIDSININKYANIKTRIINFDDIKVKENQEEEEGFNTLEEARQELINRCNQLFNEGIDQPRVNYKIEMVDLSKTTAYKDYVNLEKVTLGDTVTCRHNGIDIDIKARCISLEYDCITEKIISLELGNFQENYFNNQSDITNRVNDILNKTINSDGSLKAEQIKGFINSTNAKIKAQKDVAQKQHVRAILFEDLDPISPTYGCVTLGTQGIMCSNKRNIDNTDWEFNSALTAEGLIADKIVGNLFSSKNGNTTIDMNTGEFKSKLIDGSEIVMSPTDGFYQKVGSNKREYYNLSYNTEVDMNNGTAISGSIKTMVITLPEEFRGKKFSVSLSIKRMESPVDGGGWFLTYYTSYIRNKDYINGTFEIYANMHWHRVDSNNQITIGKVTYPELIIDVTA